MYGVAVVPHECARRCGYGGGASTSADAYDLLEEEGCSGFWGCLAGGVSGVGRFVWEHKNTIAAVVCVTSAGAACALAVGIALVGN